MKPQIIENVQMKEFVKIDKNFYSSVDREILELLPSLAIIKFCHRKRLTERIRQNRQEYFNSSISNMNRNGSYYRKL